MHIMVVCTGNVCRSPMGELLLARYLEGTSIRVSSAGTQGLPGHPIDPSSARLMASANIDSSGFRSRRLTKKMAQSADLILCFEKAQRRQIVGLAPSAVRYTFLVNEFADMCKYCAEHKLVQGVTVQARLQSVTNMASVIRASLPQPRDIADPYGRPFESFQAAAEQTNGALRTILGSMRKHYAANNAAGWKLSSR